MLLARMTLAFLCLGQRCLGQGTTETAEPPQLAQERARFERECERAIAPVKADYVRRLAELQDSLVRAGKLQEAVLVQKEKDGLDPRPAAPAAAKARNIAAEGRATASSFFAEQYEADKTIDGITGTNDRGEWVSKGEKDAWVRIEFDKPRVMDRVVLYDRKNPGNNVVEVLVTLSDGTSVKARNLDPQGKQAKAVQLPGRKTAKWVQVTLVKADGPYPGLAEVEIWGW